MKMKYKINELTPEAMRCISLSCPAIYEGVREITPQEMNCGISGVGPSSYEAKRNGEEVYLLIGKVVNPSEVGLGELEGRIGTGEALIEVPKNLIDKMQK